MNQIIIGLKTIYENFIFGPTEKGRKFGFILAYCVITAFALFKAFTFNFNANLVGIPTEAITFLAWSSRIVAVFFVAVIVPVLIYFIDTKRPTNTKLK